MELDLSQYSEADRRAVDPPVRVEIATWSYAGQLDWWVKEHWPRLAWFGRVRGADGGSGGSKRLIFVPQRLATMTCRCPRLHEVMGRLQPGT